MISFVSKTEKYDTKMHSLWKVVGLPVFVDLEHQP